MSPDSKKPRGRVYTALGGMYPKYQVIFTNSSGRGSSPLWFDTLKTAIASAKLEIFFEPWKSRWSNAFVYKRTTKPPKRGHVLTKTPEYKLIKEFHAGGARFR